MSLGIAIKIDDQASASLRDLASDSARRRVNARATAAVSRAVQNHLRAKGPNKQFPAASTGFYASAARSVVSDYDARGGTVSIQKLGIAQRYHGGAIRPRNVKNLTLPVIAEAYGKRASEFADLKVRIRRVDGAAKAVGLEDSAGTLFFRFTKLVMQRPDPSVLPDERTMGRVATDAMSRQIEREWNTPQPGGQP